MNDSSLTISVNAASELIALALVGVMTKATYMELMGLLGNARIIDPSILQDGSANSSSNAETQEQTLGQLSTRSEELQTQESNTPPSP